MDKRDEMEIQRLKRACTPATVDTFTDSAVYNSTYKTYEFHRTANMGMVIVDSYRFFSDEGVEKAAEYVNGVKQAREKEWGLS
jgi:hypothetical protein